MQRRLGSSLSLKKLFYTKKGIETLLLFLDKTGIAIRKWLIAAGSLEGGNFY
jgi:hypothetical protein